MMMQHPIDKDESHTNVRVLLVLTFKQFHLIQVMQYNISQTDFAVVKRAAEKKHGRVINFLMTKEVTGAGEASFLAAKIKPISAT